MQGIVRIAILCIVIGSASIPISFGINSNPFVVWLGNAAGSLLSAVVVIYIGDRITSDKFKKKISKHKLGRKIVVAFDQGDDSKRVIKARNFINKHGLRLFALVCPIFPGVTISTVTIYLLGLDKKKYKFWMYIGVFLVSGAYVFGYWWFFVRT